MIVKRWIDGISATQEEWDRIDSILAARGWMSLNRELTRILVAEDDGRLIAFLVLQAIPHTEPLWVAPSARGTSIAQELADDMVAYLKEVGARGWMLVADHPIAARMAEERGMFKVESPVYVTR
jgi:predicted N-acetyltransferase YhbS